MARETEHIAQQYNGIVINVHMMRSRMLKYSKNTRPRKTQVSRMILMIPDQWMAIALRHLYVSPGLPIS